MSIVRFPARNLGDIPAGLRNLAGNIEANGCDNVAFVVSRGAEITVGLLGSCAKPDEAAHLLFGRAMRGLERL